MQKKKLLLLAFCVAISGQQVSSSELGTSTAEVPSVTTSKNVPGAFTAPNDTGAASRNARYDAVLDAAGMRQAGIPALKSAEADPDIEIRVLANFFRARWGDSQSAVPLRGDLELLSRLLLSQDGKDEVERLLTGRTAHKALTLLAKCGHGLAVVGDFTAYEMAVAWLLPNSDGGLLRTYMDDIVLSCGDAEQDIQDAAGVDPVALLCALAETEKDSACFFSIWIYGRWWAYKGNPDILRSIAACQDPPLENIECPRDTDEILDSLRQNNLETSNFENAVKRLEEKKNPLTQQEPQGLMDISVKRIPLGVVRKGETVKETLSFRIEEGATVELSTPDGTPEMAIAMEPVESDKTQYSVNVTWTPKEPGHLANVPIVVKATKGDVVDERRILCLGLVARDSAPDWSFERIMTDNTREWWDLDKLK